MEEDPQDYLDSSSCCHSAVTMHLHPEEQNDLQLDNESDTSGIYFPPSKGKSGYISVDVENNFDDIGDSNHAFSESSTDLEQVINPISNNAKPIRSPYLLRSRSSSPVRCIAGDENLQIYSQFSQSSLRQVSKQKNSLPPVQESDESVAFKVARKSVACSSKFLEDDNSVDNIDDDQNNSIEDSGDKTQQEDLGKIAKTVKNGPLVLNINFSLNCEKDKPLVLNINPQYQGTNSTEEINFQCNASTSTQNQIEDHDKTVEISSSNNEEGSQIDKVGSQTDKVGSQTDKMGSQTDEKGSQTDEKGSQTDKKGSKTDDMGSQKKKPKAKVAKNRNKSQTKKVDHKVKEKKKVEPKRPKKRPQKSKRSANCNLTMGKICRHYSTSSSSDECCCSDSTLSSSSCSCSSCCSSSSCDCGNCGN